jgi:hypothetical protein
MKNNYYTTLTYSTESGRICRDCREPVAKTERFQANKNDATAAKKKAAHPSRTGASNLFGYGDDQCELVAASRGRK